MKRSLGVLALLSVMLLSASAWRSEARTPSPQAAPAACPLGCCDASSCPVPCASGSAECAVAPAQ